MISLLKICFLSVHLFFQWWECEMSPTDIDSRRMHEETNRCPLHRQSIASRNVGHRYALDIPIMESCVAHGSFTTYNWGACRADSAVRSEKNAVLMQKKQPKDIESPLSENLSLSHSIGSAKKYSSSEKNHVICDKWWTNCVRRRNGWTTIFLFFICLLSCATICTSNYVDCSHGLDMLGSKYFIFFLSLNVNW